MEERCKKQKKLIVELENRIQNLQNSAFQLANYYFVFQGIVLAAISNVTSLTCSDAWFIFTPSLIAAILNFFALFSIGSKYTQAMNLRDQAWSEYNSLLLLIRNRDVHNRDADNDVGQVSDSGHTSDTFSRNRRYVVLGLCMLLFLGFAGVTLSGPWGVMCKHDRKWKKGYGDMDDCLKLCNGSRCMVFCPYTS